MKQETKRKVGAGRGGKLESGEETYWEEARTGGCRETQGELVVGVRSLGLLRANHCWVRGWGWGVGMERVNGLCDLWVL